VTPCAGPTTIAHPGAVSKAAPSPKSVRRPLLGPDTELLTSPCAARNLRTRCGEQAAGLRRSGPGRGERAWGAPCAAGRAHDCRPRRRRAGRPDGAGRAPHGPGVRGAAPREVGARLEAGGPLVGAGERMNQPQPEALDMEHGTGGCDVVAGKVLGSDDVSIPIAGQPDPARPNAEHFRGGPDSQVLANGRAGASRKPSSCGSLTGFRSFLRFSRESVGVRASRSGPKPDASPKASAALAAGVTWRCRFPARPSLTSSGHCR
jgi:hypothetical protein